jgi:putative addiction module component (TIGR02574 family)
MMKPITTSDIANMPVEDRLQLVEDIWDSIAELPEAVEIPEWHKLELEKRLKAYHKNPDAGSPWSEVKKRILKK